MVTTNAVEFEAKIDADWKISIPVEYREYLSSSSRVILLPKSDSDTYDDLIKASESSLDFWDNEDDEGFNFTPAAKSDQPSKPSGGLPFGRGCMKGKMWMADDFDAPLEDMKEYME
jgi:hypothetical protein